MCTGIVLLYFSGLSDVVSRLYADRVVAYLCAGRIIEEYLHDMVLLFMAKLKTQNRIIIIDKYYNRRLTVVSLVCSIIGMVYIYCRYRPYYNVISHLLIDHVRRRLLFSDRLRTAIPRTHNINYRFADV